LKQEMPFFFGGWGGRRRKNFIGMVSNPNVVKLINYVWWVSSLSKCTTLRVWKMHPYNHT
jgi:hypothetical protein